LSNGIGRTFMITNLTGTYHFHCLSRKASHIVVKN